MDHSSSRHSATGHVRLMIVLFYCALAIALSGKCIQAAHHSYFGIRNEYASSHYWSGIIPTPKNVTQALADTVLNYFTEMIAVCPNELDVKPSDQCVPREFLLSKRYESDKVGLLREAFSNELQYLRKELGMQRKQRFGEIAMERIQRNTATAVALNTQDEDLRAFLGSILEESLQKVLAEVEGEKIAVSDDHKEKKDILKKLQHAEMENRQVVLSEAASLQSGCFEIPLSNFDQREKHKREGAPRVSVVCSVANACIMYNSPDRIADLFISKDSAVTELDFAMESLKGARVRFDMRSEEIIKDKLARHVPGQVLLLMADDGMSYNAHNPSSNSKLNEKAFFRSIVGHLNARVLYPQLYRDSAVSSLYFTRHQPLLSEFKSMLLQSFIDIIGGGIENSNLEHIFMTSLGTAIVPSTLNHNGLIPFCFDRVTWTNELSIEAADPVIPRLIQVHLARWYHYKRPERPARRVTFITGTDDPRVQRHVSNTYGSLAKMAMLLKEADPSIIISALCIECPYERTDSLHQQTILADTAVLVARSGAAVLRASFLPPGTAVVELQPGEVVNPSYGDYVRSIGLMHLLWAEPEPNRMARLGVLDEDVLGKDAYACGQSDSCTSKRQQLRHMAVDEEAVVQLILTAMRNVQRDMNSI